MANSITKFKKYIDLLDEVYKNASLTSVLDGDSTLVRMGANANEIIIPKISMDGLADYSRNGGMLKATQYADRAGSVHGKFIVTDEVTEKDGKPCIGGKTYDIWGIGENYVIVSARGDKRYVGSANAKKVVTHPNEKGEDAAYKLIYDIYKMLQ